MFQWTIFWKMPGVTVKIWNNNKQPPDAAQRNNRVTHKNLMNLRKVTIWTTGVVLLLTMLVPTVLSFYALYGLIVNDRFDQLGVVGGCLFLFLCSSSLPLVVSYFITRHLKTGASFIVILSSTIVYALVYIHAWYQMMFFANLKAFGWLLACGMVAFFFMIPVLTLLIGGLVRNANPPRPNLELSVGKGRIDDMSATSTLTIKF